MLFDILSKSLFQLLPDSLTCRAGASSPVPHLLETNAPPTKSEREEICRFITQQEQAVQSLKDTNEPDSTLKPKISALQATIASHTALLSSIRLLPPEIFLEIAYHAQREPTISDYNQTFYLSQVCRSWRHIYNSTPAFWTHIVVDLNKPWRGSQEYIGFLNGILRRSNQLPLKITLRALRERYSTHPAIDALVREAERWESADLRMHQETLKAFKSIEGRLHILRRLHVSIRDIDASTSLFLNAPSLTHVEVGLGCPSLPWQQLQSLKVVHSSSAPVQQIFHPDSLITSLVLLNFAQPTVPLPSVTLDKINHLVIQFRHQHPTPNFFSSINLPSLREASLEDYNLATFLGFNGMIQSHFYRSTIQLQRLELTPRSSETPGDLLKLLRLVPTLLEFKIYLTGVNITELGHLANHSEGCLLPVLRKLTFTVTANLPPEIDYRAFVKRIAAHRCDEEFDCHPQLHTFQLCYPTKHYCQLEHERLEQHWHGLDLSHLHHNPDVIKLTNFSKKIDADFALFAFKSARGPRTLKEINEWFSDLERMEVTDVQYLYLSRIHHSLHHLVCASPRDILDNRNFRFRDRSRRMLDRWLPLFSTDLHDRVWRYGPSATITYVPKDHELRLNKNVVQMIFGYGW